MNQARTNTDERVEREPEPESIIEFEDLSEGTGAYSDLLEVIAAARWVQEQRAQGELPN